MDTLISIVLVIVGIVMLALLIKVFKTPLKWAFKLFLNAVSGFVGLIILNFLGGFIGISLGITWLNAIVVGVLGVPGVVLLLLIKYFF